VSSYRSSLCVCVKPLDMAMAAVYLAHHYNKKPQPLINGVPWWAHHFQANEDHLLGAARAGRHGAGWGV
jgi:hypothetical protein